MEEQELKNIWKNSSNHKVITLHMEQLIRQFKSGMENRERIVRGRDFKEIVTSLIIITICGILAIQFWFSLFAVGWIVTASAFCFYIYKIRRSRKSNFSQDLFLPITHQLRQQKRFMESQKQLLGSVLYWAVMPIYSGYMLIVWSVWDLDTLDHSPILEFLYPVALKSKTVYTVVFLITAIWMVWTNKKAVKVNWEPLILQIDAILDNLNPKKTDES